MHIFHYLSGKDLSHIMLVSKIFYILSNNTELWKNLCHKSDQKYFCEHLH